MIRSGKTNCCTDFALPAGLFDTPERPLRDENACIANQFIQQQPSLPTL
jgi:hypothetical protein